MASLPFLPSAAEGAPRRRQREPMTGARRIIVVVTAGFALFLMWAMLTKVDEVTAGAGKVIPSSKIQLIQASEPATIRELLVRSGQRVRKGQVLARLDDTQSSSELGQIEAETRSLSERSARLQTEGMGGSTSGAGDEAALSQVRRQALSSRVAALQSSAEQRRREAAEANATIASLQREPCARPEAGRDARAAGGEEYRPADRTAQCATRSDRPPGPHRRRSRTGQPRQRRGQRGAQPGQ